MFFQSEFLNALAGAITIIILGFISLKLLSWFLTPKKNEKRRYTSLSNRLKNRGTNIK